MTMIKLLKDKEGHYSLRKVLALLFSVVIIISWVAQVFFKIYVPESMFSQLIILLKEILININ